MIYILISLLIIVLVFSICFLLLSVKDLNNSIKTQILINEKQIDMNRNTIAAFETVWKKWETRE